jgi:hypothetical protein
VAVAFITIIIYAILSEFPGMYEALLEWQGPVDPPGVVSGARPAGLAATPRREGLWPSA